MSDGIDQVQYANLAMPNTLGVGGFIEREIDRVLDEEEHTFETQSIIEKLVERLR